MYVCIHICLYSGWCQWRNFADRLLQFQQLTRSQQMDELLDVLIESGGEHYFY